MIRTRAICSFFNSPWMAIVVMLGVPLSAPAAWLGYKNDTRAVIVVQTSINVNGRIIHGKAHTLYPGEVAWDNIAAAGSRQVVVADPKANNRIVASETINVQNQDILLSAQLFQPPQVPGKAIVPPVLRLVGIKAPVAVGTDAEKPKPKPNPMAGQPPVPKGALPPTVTPKAADTPKAKTPAPPKAPIVPSGNAPPTVKTPPPPPKDAPKGPSKESPKESPKTPPAPVVPDKSKSG